MYWLAILGFLLAAGLYAYSISGKVQVAGCNTCPKNNSFADNK